MTHDSLPAWLGGVGREVVETVKRQRASVHPCSNSGIHFRSFQVPAYAPGRLFPGPRLRLIERLMRDFSQFTVPSVPCWPRRPKPLLSSRSTRCWRHPAVRAAPSGCWGTGTHSRTEIQSSVSHTFLSRSEKVINRWYFESPFLSSFKNILFAVLFLITLMFPRYRISFPLPCPRNNSLS